MKTYLERYISGEHQQVWEELMLQGAAIRQEPLLNDSMNVAKETMNRVLYNLRQLTTRLASHGYVFGIYPNGKQKLYGYKSPINLPKPDVVTKITEFEALDGIEAIPLSLRLFWEIVGDVNFIGYHPSWPSYSDPLVVYPFTGIQYEYANWREELLEDGGEISQFKIPISPDFYHKDNVSGGEPYVMKVPNHGVDGVLENEKQNTSFVNYLRICFRYGGFPGFQWSDKPLPRELSELTDGLMPI